MKRRNSKKTGVIALIAGLSSITLVSIGFASWVISGGDTTDLTGTISVDEIDDGRFLIEKTGTYEPTVSYGSGTSIVFGAPADSTAGWLTNDSEAKVNLTATVTFYVANLTGKTKGTDYDIKGSIVVTNDNAAAKTAFDKAVTDKLVELPAISDNSSFTVDSDTTHKSKIGDIEYTFTKVTLTLTFKWGTYFGNNSNSTGVNPYDFYNTGKTADGKISDESEKTWADDAVEKLGAIRKANGANYKLTLTTTLHTSN